MPVGEPGSSSVGGLAPRAGAVPGSGPCPATRLSWDNGQLVASDAASGRSVRLPPGAPRTLICYRFTRDPSKEAKKKGRKAVHGLAVVDADGLVLADLPGEWPTGLGYEFAARNGLKFHAWDFTPIQARQFLSRRAPGWGILRGLPVRPPPTRRQRIARWALMIAGVVCAAYAIHLLPPHTWRWIRSAVMSVADVLELKWLALMVSPLGAVIAPAFRRIDRALLGRRIGRGQALAAVDRSSGPRIAVNGERLEIGGLGPDRQAIRLRNHRIDHIRMLLYRCEDLKGLLILDRAGVPLYHFPGRWAPADVNRFAVRHGITYEVRDLTRPEYATLANATRDASP